MALGLLIWAGFVALCAVAGADCTFKTEVSTITTPSAGSPYVIYVADCEPWLRALSVTCEVPAADGSESVNLMRKQLTSSSAVCSYGFPGVTIPGGLDLRMKIVCATSACVM